MTEPDTSQLDADALKSMTPDQINTAREAGRLVRLMTGRDPEPTITGQITREDLGRMTPEAIVQARSEGRLDTLLGITNH